MERKHYIMKQCIYKGRKGGQAGRLPALRLLLVFLLAGLLAAGCAGRSGAETESSRAATESETEASREEPEASLEETTKEETMPEETTKEETAPEETEETTPEETNWLDWEPENPEPDHIHTYGEWTVIEKAAKYQAGLRERDRKSVV